MNMKRYFDTEHNTIVTADDLREEWEACRGDTTNVATVEEFAEECTGMGGTLIEITGKEA